MLDEPSPRQIAIGSNIAQAYGPGATAAVNVTQAVETPALSLHQLPSPPRDFTGREGEMKELLTQLEQGGVTISGLRGLGGVGKTALALKLAEELTPHYPDAQFYLDLKGTTSPLSPAEAMGHVVRAYYPTSKLPESEAELHGLYCTVLHGQHALLLMDNVRDAAQVELLIPPAMCVLLVTSRWHFTLPGLFAKNLDTLPLADARALLLRIVPRIGEQADKIAKLCGCLPLALRATGSRLAVTPDLDVDAYTDALRDERTRLEQIGAEGVDVSVEASLNLSYQLLEEAARVFRLVAVFPGSFDAAAGEAVCEDAGHRRLSELVRYSLVEWNETMKRYSLHDLVRLFAEARSSEDERAAGQQRHAAHYQQVLWAADSRYLEGGDKLTRGLAWFDQERTNIQVGQAWAKNHSGSSDAVAEVCSNYAWSGSILNLRLHPRDYILWLDSALTAARQIKNREAEGAHLGNLGSAYLALGDAHRAIEFYEQALAIDREIGNRRGEGAALGNLGLAYAALGDARRAIEFYEQQLVIVREIGDRRGEGTALGNLGLAYLALGDARRAIEFYEQSLVIACEIGDRLGEGNALGNLGLAYLALGDARHAIEFYEQALMIDREIGDRRGEGNALGNLGLAYAALGDARRAIEFYEQHQAIAREIGDRRGEGNALGNLGVAYKNLGDAQRAIEIYEQSLVIAREIGDRRGESKALGNLGSACYVLGDAGKAIQYHEQALVIAHEIGDRQWEGGTLGNLGCAYAALGEARRAIEFYEQQLVIVREIGDRRGEGNALGNLGSAYAVLGDARRAIEFYEQQLVIVREIGDWRGEGATLGNLGSAYFTLDACQRAAEHYEKQRAIAQEIGDRYGEGNALWGLAICSKSAEDMPQVFAYAEAALKLFEAIESPSAQTMRDLLTKWHGGSGEVKSRGWRVESETLIPSLHSGTGVPDPSLRGEGRAQ